MRNAEYGIQNNKMTDEQIIKALECCSMGSYPACRDCSYHDDYVNRGCINKRNADIKDLINRQKAEIERLKETNNLLIEAGQEWQKRYDTTKAEAIKEFAERLKTCAKEASDYWFEMETDAFCEMIDELVKETIGNKGVIRILENDVKDARESAAKEFAHLIIDKAESGGVIHAMDIPDYVVDFLKEKKNEK